MTSRHYCLTFFNKPKIELCDKIRYAIYGEEICPETKKTHWQAYIELYSPTRMSGIKKIYNDKTIHIETRRGTRDQARDYCKKDNKYTEHGRWIKGQGHRTDLETVVEDLKNGKKLSELALEQPALYCQYRNGLKDITSMIQNKKLGEYQPVEVILLTGPTRCGKTRTAKKEATYTIHGSELDWWQGYENDECILIDEYNNDQSVSIMLKLLDNYRTRLNVKGSHTVSNFKKIFITTNLKPHELHPNAKPAHRDALFARISEIKNMWPVE